MLGVRKNYKTFIIRCDRQLMAVYMKASGVMVLGKFQNFHRSL
ncbi:Uncharacterized protein dnm_033970 [Desulfonema magnum]|uniref:Uncharacterized protein n=1 Tax=Desulfonema magnum TaxID=45655 RepID=A0A975BL03_9BACT|nr:Uncharacterized protein dnm_033970 [Desulfonema magnum]